MLAIVELANFPMLRRKVGRHRAGYITRQLAGAIERAIPGAVVGPIGIRRVELELLTHDGTAAERHVAAIAAIDLAALVEHPALLPAIRIGAAVAPRGEYDDVDLIEAAESAIDRARKTGQPSLLDLTCPDTAIERRRLMHELSGAIAGDALFVEYQPKIHLRRGGIASAEALIRWRHPVRGIIPPGDFIDLAEEIGAIGEMTLWTLRRVIEDQRHLRSAGHDFPIYVNISGQLLADAGFVGQVETLLVNADAAIGFEITETSVIRDPDLAIANLHRFAKMGIPIAIDDYGAGLSSLSYLKQLPARELKIDKLFVMQLTSSHRDPLIVRSTIDLAHALDMEVTAEGVETPAALALLTVMGCDMAQGYLISRPIGLAPLIAYCDSSPDFAASASGQFGFGQGGAFWRRSG